MDAGLEGVARDLNRFLGTNGKIQRLSDLCKMTRLLRNSRGEANAFTTGAREVIAIAHGKKKTKKKRRHRLGLVALLKTEGASFLAKKWRSQKSKSWRNEGRAHTLGVQKNKTESWCRHIKKL